MALAISDRSKWELEVYINSLETPSAQEYARELWAYCIKQRPLPPVYHHFNLSEWGKDTINRNIMSFLQSI